MRGHAEQAGVQHTPSYGRSQDGTQGSCHGRVQPSVCVAAAGPRFHLKPSFSLSLRTPAGFALKLFPTLRAWGPVSVRVQAAGEGGVEGALMPGCGHLGHSGGEPVPQ